MDKEFLEQRFYSPFLKDNIDSYLNKISLL